MTDLNIKFFFSADEIRVDPHKLNKCLQKEIEANSSGSMKRVDCCLQFNSMSRDPTIAPQCKLAYHVFCGTPFQSNKSLWELGLGLEISLVVYLILSGISCKKNGTIPAM